MIEECVSYPDLCLNLKLVVARSCCIFFYIPKSVRVVSVKVHHHVSNKVLWELQSTFSHFLCFSFKLWFHHLVIMIRLHFFMHITWSTSALCLSFHEIINLVLVTDVDGDCCDLVLNFLAMLNNCWLFCPLLAFSMFSFYCLCSLLYMYFFVDCLSLSIWVCLIVKLTVLNIV